MFKKKMADGYVIIINLGINCDVVSGIIPSYNFYDDLIKYYEGKGIKIEYKAKIPEENFKFLDTKAKNLVALVDARKLKSEDIESRMIKAQEEMEKKKDHKKNKTT